MSCKTKQKKGNDIEKLRKIYKKIWRGKPLTESEIELLDSYGLPIEKFDGANGVWMTRLRYIIVGWAADSL